MARGRGSGVISSYATRRRQAQPARPRESDQVQSVERAAALLRAVAAASGPAATATALAQTVGLNRTTTWRILATLEQQRLVSLDRDTGWYSLGFGLIDLAGQAGGASLARRRRPRCCSGSRPQTGETAALGGACATAR